MDDLIIAIIVLVVIVIAIYVVFKGLRVLLLKILKIEEILSGINKMQGELNQTIAGLNKIEQNNKERHQDTMHQLKGVVGIQNKFAKSLDNLNNS